MLITILEIGGFVISVGAVVVALATRLNDVKHLGAAIDTVEKTVKELSEKVEGNTVSLARLEEQFSGFEKLCRERHKEP